MGTKNGFTLIEVVFALVIIGIISVSVSMRLNSFSNYNNLEKEVWKVFKEFSSLRTKAMKDDCTIRVAFLSTSRFSIHTDLNNNGVKESIEKQDTTTLPLKIVFGLPLVEPPATAPAGTTLPSSGSFSSGDWKTRGIIIDSTAAAIVNTGSFFINSSAIKKYTFCIAVTDSTQIFKMYKWDGSTWIDLQ